MPQGRTVPKSGNRPQDLFMALITPALSTTTLRLTVAKASYDLGAVGEPEYELLVRDESFFRRVLMYGNLGFGEAWMDGHVEIARGPLHGLLTHLAAAQVKGLAPATPRLSLVALALRAASTLRGRLRNARHHYDLGDECFFSFLDATLTYSCGYARSSADSLAQLQHNKLNRICRKLRLKAGDRLLDIGCGYGGLLLFAAKHYNVKGCGVTNARRHHAVAMARAEDAGLTDRLEFVCDDFSAVAGAFDKVVSVGMLEHLPRRAYRRYFEFIAARLHAKEPPALGLIHCIGANAWTNQHDPFIQKYIFPGSNQPRLSEITRELERNSLPILDIENIVRHYGFTIERWLDNFHANFDSLPRGKYNKRVKRMWEYYFHCGIAAARASDGAVYQVLFGNDHTMDIPLMRV